MLCALYARVSTTDQFCDSQLTALREYVKRAGWEVFKEYVDVGFSGARIRRPAMNQMIQDASERRFQVVIAYKMDRVARSVLDLNLTVQKLKASKVFFISVTENINTSDESPMGVFLMQVLACFAEFERNLITERIRSGLYHARKNGTRSGKPCGRPKKVFRRDEVCQLRREGVTLMEISRRLGIGYGTVRKALAETKDLEWGIANGAVDVRRRLEAS